MVILCQLWFRFLVPYIIIFLLPSVLLSGTIMTISKDRVKPSPKPDSWKLNEIFATGIVIGTYLALITVLFYWFVRETDFFEVCHNLLIA